MCARSCTRATTWRFARGDIRSFDGIEHDLGGRPDDDTAGVDRVGDAAARGAADVDLAPALARPVGEELGADVGLAEEEAELDAGDGALSTRPMANIKVRNELPP